MLAGGWVGGWAGVVCYVNVMSFSFFQSEIQKCIMGTDLQNNTLHSVMNISKNYFFILCIAQSADI